MQRAQPSPTFVQGSLPHSAPSAPEPCCAKVHGYVLAALAFIGTAAIIAAVLMTVGLIPLAAAILPVVTKVCFVAGGTFLLIALIDGIYQNCCRDNTPQPAPQPAPRSATRPAPGPTALPNPSPRAGSDESKQPVREHEPALPNVQLPPTSAAAATSDVSTARPGPQPTSGQLPPTSAAAPFDPWDMIGADPQATSGPRPLTSTRDSGSESFDTVSNPADNVLSGTNGLGSHVDTPPSPPEPEAPFLSLPVPPASSERDGRRAPSPENSPRAPATPPSSPLPEQGPSLDASNTPLPPPPPPLSPPSSTSSSAADATVPPPPPTVLSPAPTSLSAPSTVSPPPMTSSPSATMSLSSSSSPVPPPKRQTDPARLAFLRDRVLPQSHLQDVALATGKGHFAIRDGKLVKIN